MAIHRHHSTPVHLGGHGPIQLLEDRDHAKVHFDRFMSGEDPWLHGTFLAFLSEEDKQRALRRYTEVGTGANHPNYGARIWTDGELIKFAKKCPGDGFVLGFPTSYRDLMSESLTGMVFWNNGTNQHRSRSCPGPGWKRGKLPLKEAHKKACGNSTKGTRWWTDGTVCKRAKECPGAEWKLGRVK